MEREILTISLTDTNSDKCIYSFSLHPSAPLFFQTMPFGTYCAPNTEESGEVSEKDTVVLPWTSQFTGGWNRTGGCDM